jgi:hypothetical protein
MQSIDHTKLEDTIVQKKFDAASAFLTKEQTQQLFQNKINRARAQLEAQQRLAVLTRTEQ